MGPSHAGRRRRRGDHRDHPGPPRPPLKQARARALRAPGSTHPPGHMSFPSAMTPIPRGRTVRVEDCTPGISPWPLWCALSLRASAPRGTCFGCVMAAGIVRGQVARIHLRSTPGPAPAHTAATLSRTQSVPSQMARCEHPSRSRNDLPVPGLVMPTATARGLGATCRDMGVLHESPAPDSTDNSWIVAPEPRGVATLWRIQPFPEANRPLPVPA